MSVYPSTISESILITLQRSCKAIQQMKTFLLSDDWFTSKKMSGNREGIYPVENCSVHFWWMRRIPDMIFNINIQELVPGNRKTKWFIILTESFPLPTKSFRTKPAQDLPAPQQISPYPGCLHTHVCHDKPFPR